MHFSTMQIIAQYNIVFYYWVKNLISANQYFPLTIAQPLGSSIDKITQTKIFLALNAQ